MEFWGVEVKAGEPLNIKPEDGKVIHISQAALGEGKKEKGTDIVPLRLKINGKMFVVGSLSGEKFPQISFDLVFEREFELSHDWKNGSVYFCGYSAESGFDDEEGFDSSDEDEEGLPSLSGITGNGEIEAKVEEPMVAKVKGVKPQSSTKPKVTVVEPQRDDESDDEDDESDDDSDESDDDKDMMDALGDEDDDDEEDDSEDEEDTPPKKDKDGPTKKRPTESSSKTPLPSKKAKLETPQKTDSKKGGGGHTATPHPSKKPVKSPASNSNKSKEQTQKSEGKVVCKTCNRTFNSDNALESHSKAKHGSN